MHPFSSTGLAVTTAGLFFMQCRGRSLSVIAIGQPGSRASAAANGNWYLRSTLNCALSPTLPECQTPPTPPPTPNFRAEASLYAAIPSMALLYGRNLLDTLHERVGEEFDGRGALAAAQGGYYKAAPLNAASQYLGWGRIIGMNGVQHGDSLGVLGGSAGPHFDYAFLGLQAGMDFYRQDRPDGSRDRAGGYFAIGSNQGHVTHFDGREGNSDFAAYTLGGYWTHFGAMGWYTDAILQGTFYDINSTANRGLPMFKTQGQGFAASLESGYPVKFAGGWFIEPQAQLVYQNININDAGDIAAHVHFADVDSLAARIGARFGRTGDRRYRTPHHYRVDPSQSVERISRQPDHVILLGNRLYALPCQSRWIVGRDQRRYQRSGKC